MAQENKVLHSHRILRADPAATQGCCAPFVSQLMINTTGLRKGESQTGCAFCGLGESEGQTLCERNLQTFRGLVMDSPCSRCFGLKFN